MIAVQTFWTKPMTKEELLRDLPLVVLSIQSISNFYQVHVVTDSLGYFFLSQIDFKNVHLYNELDNYKYDKRLWASAKYYTYKKFAEDDFIHFDTDIVLEKKIIPTKSALFDCQEDKLTLSNTLVSRINIKDVFKKMGISPELLMFYDNIYNVGTFYIRDKTARISYVLQGEYMLDLIQSKIDNYDVPDYFSKEEGGICMMYVEQHIISNYTEDVEFIRNSVYHQRLDNLNTSDLQNIDEFTKETSITLKELNKFDYCNLLKVNSTGYTHLFSFLRIYPIVQKQVDFYLKKYYVSLYNKITELINNENNK